MSSETPRGGAGALPPHNNVEGQQWAIERRLGEIFGKLGEKLADLTGRVEVKVKPETSFTDIGGLTEAKGIVRSFVTAVTDPELYRKWGITPPKGLLIYGPPGTGKTLLARALATEAGAVFYHLKLGTLTSKFGPNTGELLQEILGLAREQGRGVVFLDQADALALEHLLPPAQAREAGARIVAALCEKLDTLEDFSRIVVVAATSRTDVVDPSLVAPGRLDRLVEVPLPDAAAQQQILEALADLRQSHAGPAGGGTIAANPDESGRMLSPIRSSSRKSVVLVDDDPNTRQAAANELEGAEIPVRAFAEGNKAIAAIAEEKPDVIVLELGVGGDLPGPWVPEERAAAHRIVEELHRRTVADVAECHRLAEPRPGARKPLRWLTGLFR